MSNVKLSTLKYFVAIYEERSISGAARKLHATQSGVSVQLRDLESQLGVALFDRVPTGVIPTKAGGQIYRRAVSIMNEVSQLSEDVVADVGELTGEVRIGIMPTFARAILAPVIVAFRAENPLVTIKVTEGYSPFLTQMVLDGQLDIAVVPDGTIHDGLRSTFIDTDLEILVSHRAIEKADASVDLAKIDPLNFVLPGAGNARRRKFDLAFKDVSQVGHTILEMDSMMTTLDIIRQGAFCSILPGCLCLPDLNNTDIHLYPIIRPQMTVNYLLIEPVVKVESPAVRAFSERLSAKIQDACEICRSHFSKIK